MSDTKTIDLLITRQDTPDSKSYVQEFSIPYQPNMNITSCLMVIRENPVTKDGKRVNPVVWKDACLEEVCGSCSMLINGTPRQACSTLVDKIQQPIHLAPLSSFPTVRDLYVDRTVMFDALKKVHAWTDIDGPFDLGRGPRMAENTRKWAYKLSECMTCGCCYEACPNCGPNFPFIGPAAISQVRLHNTTMLGRLNKDVRLSALMGYGGITNCGNAQNCVEVCPKEIPLTTSIAAMNRATTAASFRHAFGSDYL